MKNKSNFTIGSLVYIKVVNIYLIILCSSCASLYTPGTSPAINVKNKGDVMLMAGVNLNTMGGTLAFAPSNKTIVAANLSLSLPDEDNRNSYQSFGLMAGYNHKIDNRQFYKILGGYSLGDSNAQNIGGFFAYSHKAFGSYQNISLLQTYHYDIDWISLSVSLNSFLLDFYKLNIEIDNTQVDIRRDYGFFIEPSLTVLLGKKNLKLFIQGSATTSLFFEPEFDYKFLQAGVGIRYNFSLFKEKVKQ